MKRQATYKVSKECIVSEKEIKQIDSTDPYAMIDQHFRLVVSNIKDSKYWGFVTWKWLGYVHKLAQSLWNPYFGMAWDMSLESFYRYVKTTKRIRKKDPILQTYVNPIVTNYGYISDITMLVSIWCYEFDLAKDVPKEITLENQ